MRKQNYKNTLDDVLDTNLDVLFVGYRAESSLSPILHGTLKETSSNRIYPTLKALTQSSIVYPQLTIANGAKGALENRIGFLHVCNELGDWAQIKSSIGFVIQKLMLFKVSWFYSTEGRFIYDCTVDKYLPENPQT